MVFSNILSIIVSAHNHKKKNMTYKELGKKVLEQAERPLSPKEIWERACEMGLDKERPSIGKTPWSTLGSDLW